MTPETSRALATINKTAYDCERLLSSVLEDDRDLPEESLKQIREALEIAQNLREHFDREYEVFTLSDYSPGLEPKETR